MEDIFNPKERIKKFKIDNKEEEYFNWGVQLNAYFHIKKDGYF